MQIVVTGAAGFIGSTLTDELLRQGHRVVGVDCFTDYYPRQGKEANLAEARRCDAFRFVEADLTSAEIEPIIEGAEVVFNLAGAPGLVRGPGVAATYEAHNVHAVARLIDAALAVGTPHLVHVSTSSVYGVEATGPEDAPTDPVSDYGRTKLAGERLLLDAQQRSALPLTILRYFSIYGPRQRPDMAYRIFCERMLRGEALTVFGDGGQSRSNTYVTDCVAATIAAIGAPRDGTILNIGGGREVELLEAIRILASALGVEPVIEHREAREGDQRRTSANIERARDVLGWQPAVDPAEGLARELAWVRDQPTAPPAS